MFEKLIIFLYLINKCNIVEALLILYLIKMCL